MTDMIVNAAKKLDQAKMIRYVESTGSLHATDMGRTASNFYITHTTIEVRMCISGSKYRVVPISVIIKYIPAYRKYSRY